MSKHFRFWEIDSLRGVAIVMMVVFHFLYDLNFFAGKNLVLDAGFWLYFARITATIFLFLVGVSLTLSYAKARNAKKLSFFKYAKRGAGIFILGMLITLVTFIFLRNGYIIFGVLHFIGIAIILAYPLIRYKYANLFLGAGFVAVGIFLRNFTFDFNWLVWLGFMPKVFYTLDYFPIFPWFGVVLIGIFFGNLFYKNYKRNFRLKDLSKSVPVKSLSFLGKHSLLIYLLHEVVIILLLYFLGIVKF